MLVRLFQEPMMSISRAGGRQAALLALVLAAGCAQDKRPTTPSSPSEPAPSAAPAPARSEGLWAEPAPEPATLSEAEALLEKSRAELERWALNDASAPGSAGAAQPAAAPSPAPQSEARRAENKAADAAPEAAQERPANACETACKAFASLHRASDAVCRLATDGGKRCERARSIRDDAAQRVASCGCAR